MSERDTHFAGFAKLQWNKIEALLRKHGRIPVGQMVEPDFFPEVEILLSQGAYDLMQLACVAISNEQIEQGARLHPKAMQRAIPDLTEWPGERK